MSDLKKLQQDFVKYIYDNKKTDILSQIVQSDIDVAQRVFIYQNNILSNLQDVLGSVYEVCKKLVGEKYFRKIARQFIDQHKSKSGNLDDYGAEFPEFIKQKESDHKLVYLSQLASLEWQFHQAYFDDIAPEIKLETLQKIPQEDYFNLSFTLSPSAKLINSQFPLYKIWISNIGSNDQEKIDLTKEKGEFLLIYKLFEVALEKIDEIDYLFLKLIAQNLSLFEIYENITLQLNLSEFDIGALINKYISNSVIANFNLKENNND